MLHLSIGDTLLIQCAHYEERHLGVLVGKKPGEFLVIYADLPRPALKELQKNPCVSIRYAFESTLLGFRSHLLDAPPKATGSPLFLAYPDSVRNCDVRKERRLTCNFPCRLSYNGQNVPGLIRDISSSAVRISLGPDRPGTPLPSLPEHSIALRLNFFVLTPEHSYSFRCSLLREFVANGQRQAVLRLSEDETETRKIFKEYVEYVFQGPVLPDIC
ncbi:MAG: PilZ domain-containing protein [Desulfovibrionaceae bacterium]